MSEKGTPYPTRQRRAEGVHGGRNAVTDFGDEFIEAPIGQMFMALSREPRGRRPGAQLRKIRTYGARSDGRAKML